jgi:hypothetical protein
VAYTDYMANTNPSGLATDATADVDVVVTGFASTAKVEITNNHASTVYLVNASGEPFLYVRGRGIYAYAPVTAESYTASTYSDKTLVVDMPYQDDGNLAQGAADYTKTLWRSVENKVEYVRFNPQQSDFLMAEMMATDIGSRTRVSELMTGLSSADAIIVAIECEILGSTLWTCRWILSPFIESDFFVLDTSVLDGADTLGFF